MNIFKLLSAIAATTLVILSTSCSTDKTWDNDDSIDIGDLIEEFDLGDVMVGSDISIRLNDSILVIDDSNSTEKLFKVFQTDGKKESFVGEFGDYGPGPIELGSSVSLDVYKDSSDYRIKAIAFNYSQNCILIFDIDSALNDNLYKPIRISEFDGWVLPSHYVHINDTLGFARKIMINPGGNGFTQSLCKFNIAKNELIDFAPDEHIEDNYSLFAVSNKYNRIAEVSSNIDMVKIYDFDGKLLHTVRGPQFSEKANRRKSFFTNATFADDLILAVYSGGDWVKEHIGTKLVVIDKDGNYIKTLELGKQIRDLKYHEPSGMLYLTFINDDMQIGKLNLNRALIAAKSKRRVAKMSKKAKKQVAQFVDSEAPLHFVKNTPAGKPMDTSDWVKSIDFGEVELMPQEDSTFMIFKGLTIFVPERHHEPDTLHIEKIVLEPEGRFKLSFGVNTVTPAVYAAEIGFRQDNKLEAFKGKLKIYVKEYSKPAELEFSGHFSRMESF